MADNVSALPASMQARRAALEATPTGDGSNPTPAPVPAASPAPAPASDLPQSQTNVTISREEFNGLQALEGKAKRAEARADALAGDVEALNQRLTELLHASKGSPTPRPRGPPAAAQVESWEPTPVTFTDEETKDYGESKSYIAKVVQEVLNTTLPKLMARVDTLEAQIDGVKSVAEGASKTASGVKARSYTDQVRAKVPEFDECVNHKYWHDFTESTDPITGDTWAVVIQNMLAREYVDGMVRVFDTFKQKYGVGKPAAASGYEGGMPSGGSGGDGLEVETGPKMLPFSKRKEASKKYINKDISFEEYEKIKAEYDKAESEGRVDYDK